MEYFKYFKTHAEYEAYINNNPLLPNLSYCENTHDSHYTALSSVLLTFTLSEPSNERISISGNLSPFGGSSNADGLSNVKQIIIDGNVIDMTNDITKENVLNVYGIVIDGYFYNFTTSGEHTIEYILKNSSIDEGMCAIIGSCEYQGLTFDSKMTDIAVILNNIIALNTMCFALSSISNINIPLGVTTIGNKAFLAC